MVRFERYWQSDRDIAVDQAKKAPIPKCPRGKIGPCRDDDSRFPLGHKGSNRRGRS